MNLVCISKYCDDTTLKSVFKDNIFDGQAVTKFFRLLIEGLAAAGIQIRAISSIPITRQNCKKLIIRERSIDSGDIKIEYPPVINIPVLKRLFTFLAVFFKCLLCKGGTTLLVDVLDASAGCGAVLAAKVRSFTSVGIITDMPEFQGISKSSVGLKINHFLVRLCDAYIFLTEQMNDYCNTAEKPYTVIEGFADTKEIMSQLACGVKNREDKFICLYAGGLSTKYGLDNLVKGFIKANLVNSELHIYGNGDYAKELLELAAENQTVKFFGMRENKEVLEDEYSASLLINPRPAGDEYTKYSFPSKTLEYMSSGTPVLTTRLPGIPREYDDYLFYLDDVSIEGIASTITDIYNMPRDSIFALGNKARMYVCKEKSNIKQAEKLVCFIKKLDAHGRTP